MILRVWRARSIGAGVAGYRRHFETNVLPDLQALPGFHGATLSQRQAGDAVELMVETRWTSLDAIRGFADEDIESAVITPEAREVLIDYAERVAHSEIIAEAPGASRPD